MNLQLNKISRQFSQNASLQRTSLPGLSDLNKPFNPSESYRQKRARNQGDGLSAVPHRGEEVEKRMKQMYERGKKNDSKRHQAQAPSANFYKQNQRFYQQPPTLERNIESLSPRPAYEPQPLPPHPQEHVSAVPKSSLPIKILSDEKESPYVDYESIAQAYKRYSQSSSISTSQLKQSNMMSERQESKSSWRPASKHISLAQRPKERVRDFQRQKQNKGQLKFQPQIKGRRENESRSKSPTSKRTPQMSCQVVCSYCGVYKSPQISHHCPKLYAKEAKPTAKVSMSNPVQKQSIPYNSGHRTISSSSFNNFLNNQSYQHQNLGSERTGSKDRYQQSNSSLQRSWQRSWNHQLREKSKQNYTRLRTMLGLGSAGKYRF